MDVNLLGLEVRANVFNVFNSVRRLAVNNTPQFKANGATFGDGFRLVQHAGTA